MLSFTLEGSMPSKKNNYRHSAKSGKVFIEKGTQIHIDHFVWQIAGLKLKGLISKQSIVEDISVSIQFVGESRRDLDNMVTTLLDILQKTKIIKNDSQIKKIEAEKLYNIKPYVQVQIARYDPT